MRRVERMLDRADQRRARQRPSTGARRPGANSTAITKRQLAKFLETQTEIDDRILGQDLHALLHELKLSSTPFGDDFEDYLQDLIRETSLLELMASRQIGGPDHATDIDKPELLPIIRIYSELESALDLRSRLLATGKVGSAELRAFVLSALQLPHELLA